MRKETITCHIESSLKRDIREIAEDRDQSVSDLLRDLLKEEVAEQKRHDVVRETKAAEKIERVIAEQKDELIAEIKEFNKTAKHIQSLTARGAVYGVRNWELLKYEHTDTMRKDARKTAQRRLQEDIVEDLDLDLEDEIEEIDADSESSSNRPDGWGDEE